MADQLSDQQKWLPVIGRALAHLCMHNADLGSKTIGEKASFLMALGLDITDVAAMLNTTPASIRELMRQSRNKKKKGGGNRKDGGRKQEKTR